MLISLLSVTGASGLGWVLLKTTKRKLEAETDKLRAESARSVAETAVRLLDPLEKRIDEQQAELAELREEIHEVREENRLLRIWGQANHRRISEMGGVPVTLEEVFDRHGGKGGWSRDM